MQPYDRSFWEDQGEVARNAAEIVAGVVGEYLRPASVVDVGCGVGEWLVAFGRQGATDLLGVDAPYIDRGLLVIAPDRFFAHDLTEPLRLGRGFDLAISLETAEHLPPEAAETLVESLVRLAPVILFSAAIPGQGGVHHVNEQWPAYWAERFAGHGYAPVDCLRPRIWSDDRIAFWYRQNTLLYVREDELARNPKLREARARTDDGQLALVHPHMFLLALERGSVLG